MEALLGPDEGPAVEVREGGGPFVIVCEHASNRLPRALGNLGLAPGDLERHIAWDLGAADLAQRLAAKIDADLVIQRFSRLAVDCNRDPRLADAFCALSEDTVIPGNRDLTDARKAGRLAALFEPFHSAINRLIEGRLAAGRATALLSVHSFTPVYRGVARPWHVGLISLSDRALADAMLAALSRDRTLVVGDNQPYSAKDNVDYTIRRHGLDRGLPHVMIEIRNDLLADEAGREAWADRLTRVLGALDRSVMAA